VFRPADVTDAIFQDFVIRAIITHRIAAEPAVVPRSQQFPEFPMAKKAVIPHLKILFMIFEIVLRAHNRRSGLSCFHSPDIFVSRQILTCHGF
jgi:hypothetical protein